MSKLRHTTQKAYFRSMQISGAQLFIFVEGKRADRHFYSKISDPPCSAANITCQVATASEVPEAGGGKESLKSFHNFLENQELLISDFKGKKTAALFFADKDIDDLLRIDVRSNYFVYTKTYDLEGTIFQTGDVFGAAAAIGGLGEAEVKHAIGDKDNWLRQCAETWEQWLVICVYCKKHELRGIANFGVPSQVNRDLVGDIDADALAIYIARMKVASGYSDAKFERSIRAVRRKINKILGEDRHYAVFKGKWYLLFVAAAIKSIAAGRDVDLRGFHHGLVGAVQMTLAHPNALTEHFVAAIQATLLLLL